MTLSNVTGINNYPFIGLALDPSANATIDGVPGNESWYSIGAKTPFPEPGEFLGVMGHGEFDIGYVSVVNLYTLRLFPTPPPSKLIVNFDSILTYPRRPRSAHIRSEIGLFKTLHLSSLASVVSGLTAKKELSRWINRLYSGYSS